jgi:iron complex outermembrane receptor protein
MSYRNRALLLRSAATLSVLGCGIASAPAFAQAEPAPAAAASTAATPNQSDQSADAASGAIGDIIVTATRRESRVQATPLAISALDSAAMANSNITDIKRLNAQVPSLFVGGSDGFGSTSVTIRGIGSLAIGMGADEGVGIYIDGVYQSKPYGNLFEFVDLDRVEVLRGPQGSLYGRNATGGAINIVTKQPGNEFTGEVNAQYTNYNGVRVAGYVMAPIVQDKLSIKIAAGSNTRDGWAYDPTRQEDLYNVNNQYVSASLRWTPDEATDVTLAGRLGRSRSNVQYKDANDTSLPLKIFPADYPGFDRSSYSAATLTINHDVGFATLTSISAYGHGKSATSEDSDLTAAPSFLYNSNQNNSQLSQEIRLVSTGSSPFSWVIGASYSHETSNIYLPFQIAIADTLVLFDAHLKTNSYSAYAEGTYKLTDQLSVTGGLRYNYDDKDWRGCVSVTPLTGTTISSALCNGPATGTDSRHWGSLTPHASINFQANHDLLFYVSATRGFRSGGWNFTDATSFRSGFNPETIWSYEGGLKSMLFDRRLKFNLTGFYSNYDKLQVRVNDGPFLATRNAGSARIYGVELETNLRLFDALDLGLTGSYLNAKYSKFVSTANGITTDFAGNYLSRAPKWSVNVFGQYKIDTPIGTLTPRVEYRYTSEVFYTQDNIQPQGADPYRELNLRLKYQPQNERWSLTGFVDNLTNKQFRASTFLGNLPGQVAATYSTPRIYGIRAGYSW